MSRTAIKCHCGQRIHQKDVMQTGYHMRMLGPSFVYVKFRCSRCKKLGEQFVKQNDWEAGVLKDNASELMAGEREHFAALGPIDMNEMVDFHYTLEQDADLSVLNAEFQKPRTAETPAQAPETGSSSSAADEKN